MDREIHLPRRLYPIPVGGHGLDRTCRSLRHRYGNLAPSLRRYAEGLARALRRASRRSQGLVRRTFLPDVGILSRRFGKLLPRRRPHGLPDTARQKPECGAADARLRPRARGALAPTRRPEAGVASRGRMIDARRAAMKRRAIGPEPCDDRRSSGFRARSAKSIAAIRRSQFLR